MPDWKVALPLIAMVLMTACTPGTSGPGTLAGKNTGKAKSYVFQRLKPDKSATRSGKTNAPGPCLASPAGIKENILPPWESGTLSGIIETNGARFRRASPVW